MRNAEQFGIALGVDHRANLIVENMPFDALAFWKDGFGKLKYGTAALSNWIGPWLPIWHRAR
jgi:hypothetical protein